MAAYPFLPVAPLPNVTFPTLTVTAQYPGASPETMAATVATPLETEFGQMLPGLSEMTSTSVLGSTQITLQFTLDTDLGNAETLVLEAINAAQASLPKDMPSPPTFHAVNPSDSPILILAMQSDQAADHHRRQLCGKHRGAADLPAAGSGRGCGGRPADARHPRPG